MDSWKRTLSKNRYDFIGEMKEKLRAYIKFECV
jgi:hypothetical protein